MGARAESARLTADRILDAMLALFLEQPTDQIRLDDVAERAGVTVQTVIRRFSGKDGLIAAVGEREMGRIAAQRSFDTAGDLPRTLATLIEHYETYGDVALKLLAEEIRLPEVAALAEAGRQFHRRWCAAVFAPTLGSLTDVTRDIRLAQFVALCDVYTWKLLRRDAGLSRRQLELALTELLTPLVREV